MSESLLFRIHQSQLQALEETVETWKTEHREAMQARDVEDVVHSCLDYPARMARLWDSTFIKLQGGTLSDLNAARQGLWESFDGTLHSLRGILQWAQEFEKAGHQIEGT